jgi:hypothetical protein
MSPALSERCGTRLPEWVMPYAVRAETTTRTASTQTRGFAPVLLTCSGGPGVDVKDL